MKTIDLHVHAKLSKSFPFEIAAVRQMIWQAKRTGLDGMALVEHLHADSYWAAYERLQRSFRYADGVFQVDRAFRLLTGAEVSIREGADLIAIGTLDQVSAMNRGFVSPATEGYKPAFAEAVSVARAHGLLVIGAHKFRAKKELTKFPDEALRLLDALECNGKDFHRDDQVHEAARRLGRPVVGGSDAHYWPQVGIKASVLPVAELSPASVGEAVRAGLGLIRSLPHGPAAVRLSWAYKRIAKVQRARQLAVARRGRQRNVDGAPRTPLPRRGLPG